MADDFQNAEVRATHVYDQSVATFREMMHRAPNAVMHTLRSGGPMSASGSVPDLVAGEWEVIRRLAWLGWSHYSMTKLEDSAGIPHTGDQE